MDCVASQKRRDLLDALDKGVVMIHLDARRPGVLVPAHLQSEHHLRLNLSYRFDPPDLAVEKWGIRSTLSFQGTRFKVAIPWSAVFAIVSHATQKLWTYPADIPEECFPTRVEAVRHDPVHQARPSADLRTVPSADLSTGQSEGEEEAPKVCWVRHLRVVK